MNTCGNLSDQGRPVMELSRGNVNIMKESGLYLVAFWWEKQKTVLSEEDSINIYWFS